MNHDAPNLASDAPGAPVPPVCWFMSVDLFTVRPTDTASAAHRIMRDQRLHHLPVVDGERVVGIVSQRDLHIMETLPGADPDSLLVEDAMSRELLMVKADTPLDEVCRLMTTHAAGSVLVVGAGGMLGIFTTSDALLAIPRLVHAHER
jgi:acetoin utilization protein AcuB